MELLIQDIKFGLRLLWKDKGFAITAIATLAICIAANTTIFSVINSVVLKPLPVAESDRILIMYNSYPKAGVDRASNGVPDYYDRLRDLTVFEEQALYQDQGLTIGERGSVERVLGYGVTPSFFRLLRARPVIGRIFTDAESERGNEHKVILSYGLWQKLYGGNASVLGKDLRIYGNPFTIVGVMPKDFLFLEPEVRLWRPLSFSPEQKQARHSNSWEMIGRLKPGATLQQAQAQMNALNAANLDRFPEMKSLLINAGFHTKVFRLQDEVVREIRGVLYLLWGGVLFVLLIGAVNIANLLLARSTVRTKELATRFALGAGRWRVACQLLAESVLLTACSAILGLLLGFWGLQVLSSVGLNRIPRGGEIALSGTVVLFIIGLGLAMGILMGMIPLAHAFRVNATSVLREEMRSGASSRGARVWRDALVVAQVALALVLLVGAGLLLASFRQVLAVKPGFAAAHVLTGSVSMPSVRYKGGPELRSFMARALERIRSIPGVVAAGATDTIPMGNNSSDSVILAEGYVMQPGESLVSPNQIVVTPGYFEAMGIPLVEGRFFDGRDQKDSQSAVIVDQRLAHKFWPNGSPIGKRMWRPGSAEGLVRPDKNAEWYTVAGVVGSTKLRALVDPDERVGIYYFPYDQTPRDLITFAVRSPMDPASLIGATRNAISEIDPELPLYDVRTMEERVDESLITRRSPMLLAMGFGFVALFLAAIGIYGVLAYMVAQRTREIGIRMALGSTAEDIFKLILGEGILIIAAGFALGLTGAYTLGRYVKSVLYEVRPMEPSVVSWVIALLALAALVACVLPARRATKVNPIIALRQE
ncbi:MAG TPA: ABC transporter permease [Acidobacteriota bacterium]|nr:ABC transporter permease [Acidobacteriota bacterium]